ncbi:MAG: hypothetical protein V1900_02390 [Candidatus Aenigmatarchaeota archaeon]
MSVEIYPSGASLDVDEAFVKEKFGQIYPDSVGIMEEGVDRFHLVCWTDSDFIPIANIDKEQGMQALKIRLEKELYEHYCNHDEVSSALGVSPYLLPRHAKILGVAVHDIKKSKLNDTLIMHGYSAKKAAEVLSQASGTDYTEKNLMFDIACLILCPRIPMSVVYCDGDDVCMKRKPIETTMTANARLAVKNNGYEFNWEIKGPGDDIIESGSSVNSLYRIIGYASSRMFGTVEAYLTGSTNVPEIKAFYNKFRRERS